MEKKNQNNSASSKMPEDDDFFPTNEQFERLVHQHAALSMSTPREREERKERLEQQRFAKAQPDEASEESAPLETFEPIAPVLFEPSHNGFKKASEQRKKKTNFFRARAREAKYRPS